MINNKIWKTVSTRKIAETKIFTLESRCVQSDLNLTNDVIVIDAPDWVNIIATTKDGNIVLIEQYRHGTQSVTLEIPGGAVDPGETPLNAAIRELLEETGYEAEEWILIGSVKPNPAFLSNTCFTFLARNAINTKAQNLDEGEEIDCKEVPLNEIPQLLQEGTIDHALVVSGFMWFLLMDHRISSLDPF
jgi:8-oxo-dGTP pyrophosphatase MutT (NUDIX family)